MDIRILRVIIWCRVRCCDILFFYIFSATIVAGQLLLSLSLSLALKHSSLRLRYACHKNNNNNQSNTSFNSP